MVEGCVGMAGVVTEWAVRVNAEAGLVEEVMEGAGLAAAGCEGTVRAVEGLAEAGLAAMVREEGDLVVVG